MSKRFENRVAFITGAAGSLGRATAKMLSDEGARLFLFDRDQAGLEATAALCANVEFMAGDATSATDLQQAANTARKAFGPIELLVAAAGIVGPIKPAIELNENEWDNLFAINVKGPWLACKILIPQMRELGRGSIVLFSSTAGLAGSTALPAYSASKGAVSMLTRSLALNHVSENIRVNCVCPGTIDSPMAHNNFKQAGAEAGKKLETTMRTNIPMNRFGTADEVGAAVLYLLSDSASFTTGVALPIDGGRLA